ncbi:hypothetical protein OH492_23770 [Vibrio chagasii]|nr:hypothetical protein [Vibrio chagasii]
MESSRIKAKASFSSPRERHRLTRLDPYQAVKQRYGCCHIERAKPIQVVAANFDILADIVKIIAYPCT